MPKYQAKYFGNRSLDASSASRQRGSPTRLLPERMENEMAATPPHPSRLRVACGGGSGRGQLLRQRVDCGGDQGRTAGLVELGGDPLARRRNRDIAGDGADLGHRLGLLLSDPLF